MRSELPKLDLNVTNRCNFRCAHCAFDSGCKPMGELSLDEIKRVLEETRSLGGRKLDITGGEPLVRGDLKKIISFAKGLGYKVELVTNGSLLTPARLAELRESGLDSFAISLDGASYEVYASVRHVPKHIYAKVLENINLAIGTGFDVKINSLACEENYRDLPSIAEYCIASGACELGIYYFTPVGRGKRGGLHPVNPMKWLQFLREDLMPYKDRLKISLEFPIIEKGFAKDTSCLVQRDRHHLHMLPDGEAYPCAILASYGRSLGNVKSKRMSEIWDDSSGWDSYWKSLADVFSPCDACVDLKVEKDHGYVCPLRKFTLQDLVIGNGAGKTGCV